ncbi:MAG TPA: hypothetical protein VFF96_07345 [Pseudoxanthomonas sp.]|nr:hypothetical protein [Pseudoxanthomonas sp.]
MKHRQVFLTQGMEQARDAARAARRCSIADDDISFVARPDMEINRISNRRKIADSDFVPAAFRGALYGGALGLVGSLVVLAVFGGTHWWGLALGIAMGAVLGAWASSLMGAAIVDPVRRRFASEIEAGNVLVVIDAEESMQDELKSAMASVDARQLDYDTPSVMS